MTWPIKKLGEIIFDIKDGGTPSRNQPEYFGGNINWCVVNDIQDEIWQTREKLTELGLKNSSAKVWPIDSVIISLGATIGNVGVAKIPIATKQGLAGMVVDKKQARPKYIAYILQSKKNYIQSLARGVTIKEIRPAQFARIFTLPLPPLQTQKKIVARLDTIQMAMKKNDGLIEKTEELFRTISFNNFSQKNNWKIEKLGDNSDIEILDGDRGKNYPSKSEFKNIGYCLFLNTKNVTPEGFIFNEVDFISKERDEKLRKGKLKRGDIILTTRGTVGNCAVYDNLIKFDHVRINSGMVILRPNTKKVMSEFLWLMINSTFVQNQFKKILSGTAQPQLPIVNLSKVKLLFPPIKIQQQIVARLDTVLEYKRALQARKAQLKELFDSTLAKSMKGEMDK